MKTVNIKKAILPNLPYAFIALYATAIFLRIFAFDVDNKPDQCRAQNAHK